MKTFIILFASLFLSTPNLLKKNIDYQHKSLIKSIKKVAGEGASLAEMAIPDSTMHRYNIHGKYFTVATENEKTLVKYVYIGRVNSCRAGGCSVNREIEKDAEHEYFDYAIFFNKEIAVHRVTIFNYQATHGQEVTAKGWLKQFIGYVSPQELTVGKEIDGISGATISVHGITFDVQLKTEILKSLKGK